MLQAEGYVRGACFDGMGWHYFKDLLAPNGTISWQASNLMPVVPMYDPIHGKFNAIFFASAVVQPWNPGVDFWPGCGGFQGAGHSWQPPAQSSHSLVALFAPQSVMACQLILG